MWVSGRVVDLYSRPATRDVVQETGFRYALAVGGLDNQPFYLLRGVPEDIAAQVGKNVIIEGFERADYGLEAYAVLKCATVEDAD